MKRSDILPVVCTVLMLAACSGGGGGSKASSGGSIAPPVGSGSTDPAPGTFEAQSDDPSNLHELAAARETAEYKGMGALDVINASYAYARGATGQGVTVGVIDSGVYEEHLEFAKGISGDKVNYAGEDYTDFNEPRTNDAITHGTMVAGVIAANKAATSGDGFEMHGVAYDAEILAYEIPLGSGGGPYDPVDLGGFSSTDSYLGNIFEVMSGRVDIINMSFGFSGVITDYSAASIRAGMPDILRALTQADTALGDRSIFVIAAGNAQGDYDEFGNLVDASSPELLAGIPYFFPELQDYVLTVVAVDNSGEISSYSNRCGVARAFCLAAPGGGDGNHNGDYEDSEVIWAPIAPPEGADPDYDYYGGSVGTSFAVPMVSGALALLKDLYHGVGNHELVERLLKTANKTGVYADQSIYGQGLLDLKAATSPVGVLQASAATSLDAGFVSIAQAGVSFLGSAFGDSLLSGLSGSQVALFDQMGFPFLYSASILSSYQARQLPAAYSELQQQVHAGATFSYGLAANDVSTKGWGQPADYLSFYSSDQTGNARFFSYNRNPGQQFGLQKSFTSLPGNWRDSSALSAPWLQFSGHGWSQGGALATAAGTVQVGLFSGNAGWEGQRAQNNNRSDGFLLEYRPAGQSVWWQAGLISEEQTLLGAETGSRGHAQTRFVGMNGSLSLAQNLHAFVTAYGGQTVAKGGQLLRDVEHLYSSSWSLGLQSNSLWQQGDQLSLMLSQPLRIEQGEANLHFASGRTVDRLVTYQSLPVALEPSGREQRLQINYRFDLAGAAAELRAEYNHQPWHRSDAQGVGMLMLSLSAPLW